MPRKQARIRTAKGTKIVIDFLWELAQSHLPERLFEWQNAGYPIEPDPAHTPKIVIWPFRGEPPLSGGLTALLAEPLRWLGPARTLVVTRFEPKGDKLSTWTSDLTQIDPGTFMPPQAERAAHVWGELSGDPAHGQLNVHFKPITGDQANWTFQGDLAQIAVKVIELSAELQTRLGISPPRAPDEPFDLTDPNVLAGFLGAWGELNIRYALIQAGYEDYADALDGAIRRIVSAALSGSRFACWAACRAMWSTATNLDAPHQSEAEAALVNLSSAFPRVAWPGLALSLLEWARNEPDRAADLLETAIEADPRVAVSWRLLAILYAETGEYEQALKACQEADTGRVADAPLYFLWGTLLLEGPDDSDESLTVTLNAFRAAEQGGLRAPELFLRLMDVNEALEDEASVWAAFEQLLQVDTDGGTLWQVIEDADSYDDFEPALAQLQAAIAATPNSYLLHAAYVRALIALGKHSEAGEQLATLLPLADDDYARAEVAQLALEAAAPDFEDAYGEVLDELENGAVATGEMTGLLTDALAREPNFADGAVTLALAYQSRGEADQALDVLHQALERLPDHLELTLTIADILWSRDDDDQAAQTLLDALARHPDDVALLARLGEYYAEDGEDDTAHQYLSRAEALDPRHPELARVHELIGLHWNMPEYDEDEESDLDAGDETDSD